MTDLGTRSPSRPAFDPLDTANTTRGAIEVESPSVSDSNVLARFEFESGRGNEGTKILMVEWEEDERTLSQVATKDLPGQKKSSALQQDGDWHISWEGKKTILPASDSKQGPLHRLYFLLGPGTPIPKSITLTYRPKSSTREPIVRRTAPLPAIFPPELGATAREAGKKGVLHTIWAKKRLQSLQNEIDGEASTNTESVGLAMAVQEKEWIEQHFGVAARPTEQPGRIIIPSLADLNGPPLSPATPRSPGGGRLLEKLKGLKIGTTERELTTTTGSGGKNADGGPAYAEANPLSPETGDVAMSSFSAIKGFNPASLAAKPPQLPAYAAAAPAAPPQPTSRFTAQEPPSSLVALQQQQQGHGMASLDALSSGRGQVGGGAAASQSADEDELFAVPMSARSPDMAKSPFSFAPSDTLRYLRGETAQ